MLHPRILRKRITQAVLLTGLSVWSVAALAQTLPGSSYDDYDQERYERLVQDVTQQLQNAQQSLSYADSNLRQAVARENELRDRIDRGQKNAYRLQDQMKDLDQRIKANADAQTQAKAALAKSQQDLQQSQTNLQNDKDSLARVQQMSAGVKSEYDSLQAEKTTLTDAIKKATADRDAKQRDVSNEQKVIDGLNAELHALVEKLAMTPDDANLQAQVRDKKAQIDTETQKLNQANSTLAASQSQLDSAQAAYNARSSAIQASEQRWQSAQAELKQADARVKQSDADVTQKQNSVKAAQSDLDKAVATEADLRKNRADCDNQFRDINQKLNQLARDLNDASNYSRSCAYQRDQAQQLVDRYSADYQAAVQRRDQVINNISVAYDRISAVGNADGSNDGYREGYELGSQRGASDGSRDGQSEGNSRGTSDGQQRDYNSGYASGQADGTRDATARAMADAETNGKRDGLAQGQADGLAAAYEQGRKDGMDNGDKTGSDTVAYAKGRTRGEADGLAQAVSDAQAQKPIGYSDKEKTYLAAPLNKVTIGDANVISTKFQGAQGRYSDPGDDRYYNPRPANYPHPRLTPFYSQAYDSAYRSSLESTYRDMYQRQYRTSYDSSYQTAYNNAFAQDYPQSRQSGYNDAYAKYNQEVYASVYKSEYKTRYASYYQSAFNQYKTDKGQYDRGFAVGNAVASEAKGYREGKAFAYAANIEIEKKKAYDAGVADADNLYQNNAVLKMVSASIVDQDGDGIYRPGESANIVFVVKNFGLKAKDGLSAKVIMQTSAGTAPQGQYQLVSIPAQSEATVVGIKKVVVSSKAQENADLAVTFQVLDSAKILMSKDFSNKVLYPVIAKVVGFDGTIVPNEKNVLKISLTNRSNSAQTLRVTLGTDTSKVTANRNSIEAIALSSGESKEVSFELTGKAEAQFEQTQLDINVTQADLTFAPSIDMDAFILKRYQNTADSRGLMISNNLSRGSGKDLFMRAKVDTWDLRVDGATLSDQVLANYTSKTLHIMADAGSTLSAQVIQAIANYVNKGGTIVVWGTDLDQSQVASQLAGLMDVQVSRALNINGALVGREWLDGLNVNVASGMASHLKLASVKGVEVLTSQWGTHIVSSFADGLQPKVGRIVTVSVDVKLLTADIVKTILDKVDILKLDFATKLQKAKKDLTLLPYVFAELRDEVYAAELNKSIDYYKSNSKSNKIVKAVDAFIKDTDKGSKERNEFGKGFPILFKAVNSIKDEKSRASDALYYRPGVFYPNWRDAFCSQTGNSQKIECTSK